MKKLAIVDENCAARLAGDCRRHRDLVKRCRFQLHADRKEVASELARKADGGLITFDLRSG